MKQFSRVMLVVLALVFLLAAAPGPVSAGTGTPQTDPWVHFAPGSACFAVSDHNVCSTGYHCQMPPLQTVPLELPGYGQPVQTVMQPVGQCVPDN